LGDSQSGNYGRYDINNIIDEFIFVII